MLRSGRVSWSGEAVKPRPLTHGLLDALPGIRYGFFTREGGVSSGIYRSLNCGIGSRDDRAFIFKNRARTARTLGIPHGQLATPHQIHSSEAVIVERVWEIGKGPKADAVVTNRAGLAVGVGTADCGPVLFADPGAHVVAAAHAGWRGALDGILESTIEQMESLGAERDRIIAVLGPTISRRHYEVGDEFVASFESANEKNNRFFRPAKRPGHAMFDLPGYIVSRLFNAGVLGADMGLCTYADEDRFFSYRRATHRGEADYGRLLSAITLI
ncbi:MAG: peptidoglycan editing factor PgeF [Hyphomicrobiales bacterium]|nr:peptidoglycan editing factor PgeF [Hyphomicrobiales bacterium]